MKIACFVSSHGMGHATRACAVMQNLYDLAPELQFEIFSTAHAWIFKHSLQAPFRLQRMVTDIGLVQRTPYEEDLPETLRQLAQLLPYTVETIVLAARQVQEAGCVLVLCDISPLGILAADKAGIPSVLVENFRWDWIYAGYGEAHPQFLDCSAYLSEIFTRATLHIQTEPLCDPVQQAVLVAPPISRAVRTPPEKIRKQIGVPEGQKMVLVTSSTDLDVDAFSAQYTLAPDLFFAFPDDVPDLAYTPNGVRLPHRFYHPDLVNASDAVVGKAGYSTLAEAYHAGVLFAYASRRRFRESAVLAAFIQAQMGGFEIPDESEALAWLPEFRTRLAEHTATPRLANGALQVAGRILSLV